MDVTTLVGLIVTAGGGMAAAVSALWRRVSGDLDDCKKDRVTLFAKVDDLHGQLNEVNRSVGEMRGRLAALEPHQQQSKE